MKIPKIPKLFTNVKAWLDGIASTTVAGYEGVGKYKKMEKLNKVRVIFMTSDYGIYGINEEIYAIVNSDEDMCSIEGLDRIWFGSQKRGIITYRDTNGQDFVVITDGNHEVIDIDAISDDLTLTASDKDGKKINLTEIGEAKDKNDKTLQAKLNALKFKDFGITLDLNIKDDHHDKKDLTVFAHKAMTHGFFKSLSRFPMKTILMIFMLGGFLMSTFLLVAQFMILMLYLTLKLVI